MNPKSGITMISLYTKTPNARTINPAAYSQLNVSPSPILTLIRKIQTNRFLSMSHVVLWAADPYFVMLTPAIFKMQTSTISISDGIMRRGFAW